MRTEEQLVDGLDDLLLEMAEKHGPTMTLRVIAHAVGVTLAMLVEKYVVLNDEALTEMQDEIEEWYLRFSNEVSTSTVLQEATTAWVTSGVCPEA